MMGAALADRRIRGEFKSWRDKYSNTPRKADLAWTVLARILSFAKDRGIIASNPCERGGRLYVADRRDKIWTEQDIAAVLSVGSSEIQAALILALWSGQRRGDLLRLPWSAYESPYIRLRQSKGGRRVAMPAGGPLGALLDTKERRGTAHPDEHARPPLDVRWVSHVVGEGMRAGRRERPYLSRSEGHRGGSAGDRWRQRAANRDRDRPLVEGRRSHSRRALFGPRYSAR